LNVSEVVGQRLQVVHQCQVVEAVHLQEQFLMQ